MTDKTKIFQEVKYISTGNENDQKLKIDLELKRPDTLYLYLVVLSGQLLILVCGTDLVWSSPALIKLSSNDTDINPVGRPITTVEVSLITGLAGLPAFIGTLLLSKLSDFIGRKMFLQLMGLLIFLGGIGLAMSNTVIGIIIFRCFIGVVLCGIWTVFLVYISEICEDHNRTKFGCFLEIFNQIGNLFAFTIGPIFSLRTFTFITFVPALIFLFFSVLIPETPIYLLTKGKYKECEKALHLLRNNKTKEELKKDLTKIEQYLKEIPKGKNILSLFKKRENRFALLLAIFPVSVQLLSGLDVLMQFLAPFFDAAGTRLSGNNAAILISVVKISCFTFTSFVVAKFGRSRMLIISSIGTGLPLFALGIYFYLKHINSSVIFHLQWLPLASLLCVVVFFSVGLGPIPMAIVSELFPSDLRAAATSLIMTYINAVVFTLTMSYPFISETLGLHWSMWLFSIFCLIGAVLFYFFLPQIEGKNLIEIQEILKKY